MTRARPILLTGGGTGGHVYPALAVSQALRETEPDTSFAYVGVKGGIEERIALKNDIRFLAVRTAPFPGLRRPLALIKFALTVGVGTLQAAVHLLKLRPSTLVATGGYVSAPAVFAAVALRKLRLLDLRIFVHEQNASPGRLNRLVARFADVVGLSFHHTATYLPGAPAQYVGYPVRPTLREAVRAADAGETACTLLDGIPKGRKIILAFGGSQGARTVNRAIVDALEVLQKHPDVFVLHGCGRRQRSGYDPEADVIARLAKLKLDRPLEDFYKRVAYVDDMGAVYRAASLVVSRGGAGTVKEICAVGRPSVLLPKAGLSGDHQVMNALVLEQAGAGIVLLEEPAVADEGLLPSVPGWRLAEAIGMLLQDSERLEAMGDKALSLDDPDAMSRILAAMRGGEPNAADHEERVIERVEIRLAEQLPGQLLGYVRDWRADNKGRASDEIPGYSYLVYRASSMLTASAWRARNVGVKLIGLLGLKSATPLLRHLFEDPTPASRFARLVGGDRVQNGFIRRNTCVTLRQIGEATDDAEAVLQAGVTDSYWEVRREACTAIRVIGSRLHAREWARNAVEVLLKDPSFEVRIAAIRAVGETRSMEDGLPLVRPFYMDVNWKVRNAVLLAFDRWATTGTEAQRQVLIQEFDQVLLTAGGYRPVFGLKETARSVSGSLRGIGRS